MTISKKMLTLFVSLISVSLVAEEAAVKDAPATSAPIVVAAGTALPISISQALSSSTPSGQVFAGTINMDILSGNNVVIKSGAKVQGRVLAAESAKKLRGKASLMLHIDKIEINGAYYDVRVTPLALESSSNTKKTVGKTAVSAGVGAAFDGSKGAKRGAAVGAASSVLGNRKDAGVPAGTVLQFSTISELTVK